MHVLPGDFGDSRVIELLRLHVARTRGETAPDGAHASDISRLQPPDVSFWTIWDGDALLGLGAWKRLSAEHGEIKSMHTVESARRRGAGSAMLRHLMETARASGVSRLSLETGSWAYFEPARAFYRRHGFVECPPFGDYRADPNSVFMALALR